MSNICLQCGELTERPKFCNMSCSAKYNNVRRTYKNPKTKTKLPYVCVGCGAHGTYDPGSATGKFCSNKCQGEYTWREISEPKIEAGQGGDIRRYLTETRGYRCETIECGMSEWLGKPITLHVDHVDGNSDNNVLSNVRFLCPNCHSQTETYCGRNTKNTKRNRYLQVYKAGRKQSRKRGEPGSPLGTR